MNSVLAKMRQLVSEHPDNPAVQRTLDHLAELPGSATLETIAWDILRKDFEELREDGLWETSAENDALLAELQGSLSMQTTSSQDHRPISPGPLHTSTETTDLNTRHGSPRVSIVAPPPPSATLLPTLPPNAASLPLELVDTLNHTYFLHLLATDPGKVLPPGKSLLSMMARPHDQRPDGGVPSLEDRVTDIVQRAFWDEVRRVVPPLPHPCYG